MGSGCGLLEDLMINFINVRLLSFWMCATAKSQRLRSRYDFVGKGLGSCQRIQIRFPQKVSEAVARPQSLDSLAPQSNRNVRSPPSQAQTPANFSWLNRAYKI
eukprot:TRINITY_DN6023_c1_g1_i3.p8 TRINITY_DN6023_c1_g1~~TRINITY_DN6023_c1_g1_i3.p8  ORF type:complete len:103 (-),score=1.43 TRINITY_DN6023_c1_g1_i3:1425-1733(-)